jgi:hypothetical protein
MDMTDNTPERTSRRVALRRIGTFAAAGIGLVAFNPTRAAAAEPATARAGARGGAQPAAPCAIFCAPANCGASQPCATGHYFSCTNHCDNTTFLACKQHACSSFCLSATAC